MVKNFPLIALAAFGLAAGALGNIPDQEFLHKQKTIWELFYMKPNFEKVFPEWMEIGKTHSISDPSLYTKQGVAEEFLERLRHGMLPRDAVFSPFYPVPLNEAKSLFDVFYYAKDFETFAKTAAWARQHVNPGQYVYALSIAVIHRSDTSGIQMPPFHTLCPELYFNADLSPKVTKSWTQLESETEKQEVVIPLDYSEWYVGYTGNNEHMLNYFREDIVLNSMYELANMAHPFWASAKEYDFLSKIRGEVYLFTTQTYFARHYLERLALGLGDVEPLDWHLPIRTGYYPSMNYANGLPFPQRPANASIPAYNHEALAKLQMYEDRIIEAIDSRIFIAADGSFIPFDTVNAVEYLGNIIEGNADSINPRYYGNYEALAREALSFSPKSRDEHKFVPSALQNYATSLRDPIFWSFYKKIVDLYERFKMKEPKYTYEQLAFPGVKVESIETSKLVTYFNATDYWVDGYPKGRIVVRQQHMRHYPVTYTVNVHSDMATKAAMTVFLGPKYDEYGNEFDIAKSWKYFVCLDQWFVDLKAGSNEIVRHSHEAWIVREHDMPLADVFYASINEAIAGGKPFEYKGQMYGYPDSYFLPRGTEAGRPLTMFVHVAPVKDSDITYTSSKIWGSRGYKSQSQGFPLDRPPFSHNFTLPNFQFKDLLVYHEK